MRLLSHTLIGRVVVALVVACACGIVSYAQVVAPGFRGQDFQTWWLGANAILHGRNPYTTIFFERLPGFLYPLPAALATVPFARLRLEVAGPLFIAVTCGLLAFVITRAAWWPLLTFLSASMFVSVTAAQYSPLLALGFLLSGAMWLGALKPNVGLAMLAHCSSVKAAMKGASLMLLVAAISLVSMPNWPIEWLAALRRSDFHYAPLFAPGGFLLLLALLRWRRPEGRLLAAFAVLPSSPVIYEALPLFVIPTTPGEMLFLCGATWTEFFAMRWFVSDTAFMVQGRWMMVWLMYIPALCIVLRRRNEPSRVPLSSPSIDDLRTG